MNVFLIKKRAKKRKEKKEANCNYLKKVGSGKLAGLICESTFMEEDKQKTFLFEDYFTERWILNAF